MLLQAFRPISIL